MQPDTDMTALSTLTPVILAGGRGRRLWPLSTALRPKPFLQRPGGKSFLQGTAERVEPLAAPYVVCNAKHRPLAVQQLSKDCQLVLEPSGRGTAPAVAAVAHYLARQDAEALLLVLPSDHAITKPDIFLQAVAAGIPLAKDGWLVTFGAQPKAASSHYGYIKAGPALFEGAFEVDTFIEKPGKKEACSYIAAGHSYWNSGVFLLSVQVFLAQLHAQQPEIWEKSYQALMRASRLQNAIFLNAEAFSACPALSIDYAVMEKAPRRAVIPVSMGWRDLGTWPSLLASLLNK